MNRRHRIQAALLLIALASGLAGCGQKGPLYLPEQPETPDEAPSQSASDVLQEH